MRWERVRRQHQQVGLGEFYFGPGRRWGHTCNAIKGGRFLYVFGGYGRDNCQTNQVHVFDTANHIWSQPVTKGTPPVPRDSHSCTTVGDNLFVFGGTDGNRSLKDLHILDTSSNTWICPSIRGEGPEAREGHSATLVGKRLFVFGGCGKSSDTSDEVYYNDLYILNTETFVWKRAVTMGIPPSARDSHTCSTWKNKIIVVGGEDGHDYYLSDVHILDADTLVWKELHTSGQILTPRAGHATVAFGRSLFVFGGFTDAQSLYDDLFVLHVGYAIAKKQSEILDTVACSIKKMVNAQVLTAGEGPSARFCVAGDCLDPHKGGVLVFMGGCNKNLEALDDMYYLYTGLATEYARHDQSLGRLSLKKQLKLKCQEQNLANSLHDKALVRISVDQGRENFPLNQCELLQGKIMFQAKVTENVPLGYTIETVIDGKTLHGILFSNRQSSLLLSADQSSSRKRVAMLNGDHDYRLKTPKTESKDSVADIQADTINSKDSPSREKEAGVDASNANKKVSDSDDSLIPVNPPGIKMDTTSHDPETASTSNVKDQLHQDASQLKKASVNLEPSAAAPLNLNDEQINEESDPRKETSKDVGMAVVEPAEKSSLNQVSMTTSEDLDNPVNPEQR